MQPKAYDVIIVGSGMAGLTSGAYLSKDKHSVLIIEKDETFGGLLGAFEVKGHCVDKGARGIIDSGIITPMLRQLDMGPFAYLGNMECNHGVVSMHHQVNGKLRINNEEWTFDQDVGYIEKDWGRSFPRRYIWLQGNHFKNKQTHLMVSVADIPFGLFHFEGLIAQLNHPLYPQRLATYTFARKSKLIKSDNGFTLTLKQGKIRWILEVHVSEKAELVSPQDGKMKNTIKEGLGGQIRLSVFDKDTLLFEDVSQHCGIEIEGY